MPSSCSCEAEVTVDQNYPLSSGICVTGSNGNTQALLNGICDEPDTVCSTSGVRDCRFRTTLTMSATGSGCRVVITLFEKGVLSSIWNRIFQGFLYPPFVNQEFFSDVPCGFERKIEIREDSAAAALFYEAVGRCNPCTALSQ